MMVTIREIYQWYKNKYSNVPRPNATLSPLKKIEWEEQNLQVVEDYWNSYKTKSFVGDILAASAFVNVIKKNKIEASVPYYSLKNSSKVKSSTVASMSIFGVRQVPYHEVVLAVKYDIIFDDSFYDTICTIHENNMIEFEGEILSFTEDGGISNGIRLHELFYIIQLRLSRIKIIKTNHLHEDLLNDTLNNQSQCFIATAAFGSQDIGEVIQLREFRDNILKKYFAGRCFIITYGVISPPIADLIRQSKWLRKLTRSFLRRLVLPITNRVTILRK